MWPPWTAGQVLPPSGVIPSGDHGPSRATVARVVLLTRYLEYMHPALLWTTIYEHGAAPSKPSAVGLPLIAVDHLYSPSAEPIFGWRHQLSCSNVRRSKATRMDLFWSFAVLRLRIKNRQPDVVFDNVIDQKLSFAKFIRAPEPKTFEAISRGWIEVGQLPTCGGHP